MDPNQQAMMQSAYQAGMLPTAPPQMLPTYNLAHEEQAASGLAAGLGIASTIPGMAVTVPTIGSLVLPRAISNSTAFHMLASPFDPMSAGTLSWRASAVSSANWAQMSTRAKAANMFARTGMALRAATPAIAIGTAAYMGAQYAADQTAEGARDYVATRQLLRELPQMGFGPNSVLNPGVLPGGFQFGAQSISALNQDLRSIGTSHGLDMAQTRNLVSDLGSAGMITGSADPKQVGEKLKRMLADLKKISAITQSTLDESVRAYEELDSMGLRGHAQRLNVLNRAATMSSLTGRPLSQVMGATQVAVGLGQQMGVSPIDSVTLGMRAMATGAMVEAGGGLSARYLNRVGGYDGVVGRMMEMQMGLAHSQGALGMMASTYNPDGSLTGAGDYGSRRREANVGRFFNEVDPYQIESMREETRVRAPSMMLSRIDAIQQRYAHDRTRANREQYRYLASMGIEDPQEQLAFLQFTQLQGQADFQIGRQASTDVLTQAAAGAASRSAVFDNDRLGRDAASLSTRLGAITGEISRAFNDLGEGLQRAAERVTSRLSRAANAQTTFSFGSSVGLAELQAYSGLIRQGHIDGYGTTNLEDIYGIASQYSGAIGQGMGGQSAFTGLTGQQSRDRLQGRFERAYYGAMIELPRSVGRIVDSINGTRTDIDAGGVSRMAGFAGTHDTGSDRLFTSARGAVSVDDLFMRVAAERGAVFDPGTQSLLSETDARLDARRLLNDGARERLSVTAERLRNDQSHVRRYGFANEMGNAALMAADVLSLGALGTFYSANLIASGFSTDESRLYRGQTHLVEAATSGRGISNEIAGLAQTYSNPLRRLGRNIASYLGVETPENRLGAGMQTLLTEGGRRTAVGAQMMDSFSRSVYGGRTFSQLSLREQVALEAMFREETSLADFAGLGGSEISSLSESELAQEMSAATMTGALGMFFTSEDDETMRLAAASRMSSTELMPIVATAAEQRLAQFDRRDRNAGLIEAQTQYGVGLGDLIFHSRSAPLFGRRGSTSPTNSSVLDSEGILQNAGFSRIDMSPERLRRIVQARDDYQRMSPVLRESSGYTSFDEFIRRSTYASEFPELVRTMAASADRGERLLQEAADEGRVVLPNGMTLQSMSSGTKGALGQLMSAFIGDDEIDMGYDSHFDAAAAALTRLQRMELMQSPEDQLGLPDMRRAAAIAVQAAGGADAVLSTLSDTERYGDIATQQLGFIRNAGSYLPAELASVSSAQLNRMVTSARDMVRDEQGPTLSAEERDALSAVRSSRDIEIASSFNASRNRQSLSTIENLRAADDQSARDFFRELAANGAEGLSEEFINSGDIWNSTTNGALREAVQAERDRVNETYFRALGDTSPQGAQRRRQLQERLEQLDYNEMLLTADSDNARELLDSNAMAMLYDGDNLNMDAIDTVVGRLGYSPNVARGIRTAAHLTGNSRESRAAVDSMVNDPQQRAMLARALQMDDPESATAQQVRAALRNGAGDAQRRIIENVLRAGDVGESQEAVRNRERKSQEALIGLYESFTGLVDQRTGETALRVLSTDAQPVSGG